MRLERQKSDVKVSGAMETGAFSIKASPEMMQTSIILRSTLETSF